MIAAVLTMALVLIACAGVAAVVAVGMAGRGKHAAPRLAHLLERTARHMNGDAEPPASLVKLLN